MDYKIEAIRVLLKQDCVLQRYFPLIRYKEALVQNLSANGFRTKSDCVVLSDEDLIAMGLPSGELAALFRCFLTLYDAKASKFRDIEDFAENEAEAAAFRELYLLPGVKAVRAKLYRDAGYGTLGKIASASPEQIIRDTSPFILKRGLNLKAPLPKEVRTHIAVAAALTVYAI